MQIDTIIFDLGGVLIDWNPRYLYRTLIEDESRMEYFLEHICTSDWNETQDAGRSLKEGTDILLEKHPDWETEIKAFYERWEEMLGGIVEGTLDVLKRIRATNQYHLYALTNWSAETYPIAKDRYEFLGWFKGVLVSGAEKMRKPDPKFYQLMLDRFEIKPERSIFIDDNLRNVLAARKMGIASIHFKDAEQLEQKLRSMKIEF